MIDMKVTYRTTILGFDNHASIEIPQPILDKLGTNKRAPLKITVNGYTYQSTATVMNGKCMVVFPMKDREAAGAKSGDTVNVTLELDSGHRDVDVPAQLMAELQAHRLVQVFERLTYSRRKEFSRLVAESKAPETKSRHIHKIIESLKK
jgi:bifunctional DNA-binding transcriptional regulator/antitoxin component of YhaV-PrlF toxin-antitoxin module